MAIGAVSPHSPATFRNYNAKVTGVGRCTHPMLAPDQFSRQILLLTTSEGASLTVAGYVVLVCLIAASGGLLFGCGPNTASSVMRTAHALLALLPQRRVCCAFRLLLSHKQLRSICRHVAVIQPI